MNDRIVKLIAMYSDKTEGFNNNKNETFYN